MTLQQPLRRRAALLVAALLAAAAPGLAQNRPVVRGAVVAAENGERISYALVVLEPRFSQRFADDQGTFAFLNVQPGQYHLLVRQVGFHPFDTAITVGATMPSLRIELRRIAVELHTITVAAPGRCRTSGTPDPVANGQLATIFEQLTLNAQRQAVLLDKYPFEYVVIRQLTDIVRVPNTTGRVANRTRTDTLTFLSRDRWPYAPGRVATEAEDYALTRTRLVRLPVLADFADSLFQNWHCFSYGGVETINDRRLIRLDFKPSERLREADVSGSAWLDPDSYQVTRVFVRLTHIEKVADGVESWTASSTFRDILPNLSVTERMSATTSLIPASVSGVVVGRAERQDLLRVAFRGATPGSESVP